MGRRILSSARYAFFLLAVLASVTMALHWRWLRRVTPKELLPDQRPLPCCDAAMLARLGRLDPARAGSFQVKPLAKSPGAVRIGCFGDSFTAGFETGGGLDFPAQLERLLHDRGARHVEVVNFGNTGFGFHQIHMMAELVAPRFAVDLAVYAPMLDYWLPRDGSFAQWRPPSPSLYIHGRYVLAGDDVRLVDPIGTTEAEQFRAYTGLVPSLRYLRYDQQPPAFLQVWLPPGRTLSNPFFYGPPDEIREGYRRLLRRQLALPPAVVLDPMGGVAELLERPPDARRRTLRIDVPQRFPYLAPQNHWSPWGNRLVAEYALRTFDVEAAAVVDVISTSSDAPAAGPTGEHGLPSHDEAHVLLGNRVVGGVYRYERGEWMTPRVSRFPAETRALVALVAPGQPLVDALFVPLSERPGSDEVTAEIGGTGGRVPLDVQLRWVEGGVARLDLCSARALAALAGAVVGGRCIVPVPWDPTRPERPIVIRVADHELGVVGAGPFGVLLLPSGPYYKLRADADLPADLAGLPDRGQITLVLSRKGGPVTHVALGGFERVHRSVTLNFPRLPLAPATQVTE